VSDPEFRRDLYAGTARDYERFRVPYPRELIDHLAAESGADGTGRLLDLACGTGQLTFALRRNFADVWAVDQEPGMAAVARQKAGSSGGVRVQVSAAEELAAPDESFDLVVIGNAFHRLPRSVVAARAFGWLRPGRLLALAWGGSPWNAGPAGPASWQQALAATMQRWRAETDGGRIPAGYEQDRRDRPDRAVLRDAGFQHAGRREFRVAREWTAQALAGYLFSTSVLSRAALGARATDFEADLRRELRACQPRGPFRQEITFACELARRPA
jgi:SAM-dependent methyltransferase